MGLFSLGNQNATHEGHPVSYTRLYRASQFKTWTPTLSPVVALRGHVRGILLANCLPGGLVIGSPPGPRPPAAGVPPRSCCCPGLARLGKRWREARPLKPNVAPAVGNVSRKRSCITLSAVQPGRYRSMRAVVHSMKIGSLVDSLAGPGTHPT